MRCVIIAGSPVCNISFIKSVINKDDYIICADKGYQYAVEAGIKPDLVVGDFDSCEIEANGDFEVIALQTHKDDTDTMHAVVTDIERGYNDFLLLSASGGRFDHTLANISVLQYIYKNGATGIIASEAEVIEYMEKGKKIFENRQGTTFSVFPFGCHRICLSITGAEYPLDRSFLESSIPTGISNVFSSDSSSIEIYDGNAIIIINSKI